MMFSLAGEQPSLIAREADLQNMFSLRWNLAIALGLALWTCNAAAGQLPTRGKPGSHLGPQAYMQYQYLHRSYNASRCQTCARDPDGRIHRDQAGRRAFRNAHPCLARGRTIGACSGSAIDHLQALKRGGLDVPSNMQWQPTPAAKVKDKWE